MASDGTLYGLELLNANEHLQGQEAGWFLVVNEATGQQAEWSLAVA